MATDPREEPDMTARTTSTKPTGYYPDSFEPYRIAAAISALTRTVTVTERGEVTERRLNSTAKQLAFILACCANIETGQCNPSRATLAKKMGCGERQVGDAIHLLSAAGLIQVKRGRGRAANYRLISPQDQRDTAVLDQRDTAVADRRDTAVPYVNYEVELRTRTNSSYAREGTDADTSPSPSTAAAASHAGSTASPGAGDVSTGNEGEQPSPSTPVEKNKAEVLASFIESQTGTRPDFKLIDAERIERLLIKHGKDCFNERVTWALTHQFWREAAKDNLARIVSPKGWAALTKQAENNSRADTSVSDPDYAVEADYSGGAAYAAEWERQMLAQEAA